MQLLFALGPLLSVATAGLIAEANGCTLTEHEMHPCLAGDTDIGGLVTTLFMLGFLSVGTLPLGGAAFFVWLASLIIHRIAWGQMQKGKRI